MREQNSKCSAVALNDGAEQGLCRDIKTMPKSLTTRRTSSRLRVCFGGVAFEKDFILWRH